ncbi:uncharacterized protein LOC108093685 [Drosophila ficusphila]|uniref:uncharacterized protein LOC108093685 n=1 Tax=Drosophila ficusphila TaxID=30025 RepID=UPI0007E65D1C|nr:uncharacterized protein LOC108093685 [Drosophila ficusphila]
MFFKRCCFFLPLNVGCMIIAGIFITFHVGELITHTNDTVFIKEVSHKSWSPVVMSPILIFGTLSSILLIYAASNRKRGFVLTWLVVYVIILCLYVILTVVNLATSKPPPILLSVQVVIIVGVIYSLMIVHAYYNYLNSADSDDAI